MALNLSSAFDINNLLRGNTLGKRAAGAVGIIGGALRLPEMNLSENLWQAKASDQNTGLYQQDQNYPRIDPNDKGGNLGSAPQAKANYGSTDGRENIDWYFNEFGIKTPINKNKSSSSSDSGISDAELNSLFAPAYESLNRSQGMYQDFYNQSTGNLNAQKEQQLQNLAASKESTSAKFANEEGKLASELESALSQAVRAYQGLSQRGNVMYGGSSSTGRAMGELAAKEFYRNSGEMRVQNADATSQLRQSIQDTEREYIRVEGELESEFRNSFIQLQQQFQSALVSIDNARGELESQKRERKFALADRVKELEQNLFAQAQANQQALELWKQEKMFEQQMEVDAIGQSTWKKPEQVFDGSSDLAFQSNAPKTTIAQMKRMNPQMDDEWNQLIAA